MTDAEFTSLVASCQSISQVFNKLKLCKSGAFYKIFKNEVLTRNIDISHFKQFFDIKTDQFIHKPTTTFLRRGSTISSHILKKRIIRDNIMSEECSICACTGIWQNKTLSLQLDHINGDKTDNTLENLRLLCPNCHSQTDTYAGKKLRIKYFCPKCDEEFSGNGSSCFKCYSRTEKITWPSPTKLKELVWSKPMTTLSKELGVSDNSIRKRCKKWNIPYPSKGYWLREDVRLSGTAPDS